MTIEDFELLDEFLKWLVKEGVIPGPKSQRWRTQTTDAFEQYREVLKVSK